MRDITIKLPETRLSEIENMTIRSGSQLFRLSEIAEIRHGESPGKSTVVTRTGSEKSQPKWNRE